MKLSIGVAIAIFLVVLGAWLADIANDQTKSVTVSESVFAYSDWECGYQNQPGCDVVFEIEADTVHDVQRIRYGKDFMAIKIHKAGLSGWVFSGNGVRVSAEPST